MAHKVIIFYRLYMPYYFLGTFTEYPYLYIQSKKCAEITILDFCTFLFIAQVIIKHTRS